MNRTGGVGRDELHVDRDPVVEGSPTVGVALVNDALGKNSGRCGVEPDVEEPGPGDLRARDAVDGAQCGRDVRGKVARWDPESLAQLKGHVGCPVAVIAIARPLKGDVGLADLVHRVDPARGCRRPDDIEQHSGEFCGIHKRRS